ncbi:hypothetical protein [Loigolactobacillus coryniformis]|nr:hypothetical protein [Loigolactobacillus coryniformis]
MKTFTGILEVITAGIICWWLFAIVGMFLLTVLKYLVWFWMVIN